MNFLDALKEVKEGNCKAIKPRGMILDGFYTFDSCGVLQYYSGNVKEDIHLHFDALFGEWELVEIIVRPKPGEVWTFGGTPCLISHDDIVIFSDGTSYPVYDNMVDGKNLWKRLYFPGEGINHE